MKRLLHILLGGLLTSLPSCEIPFPLEQDGEPRIYVQCIGDDAGVHVKPYYAVPVASAAGKLENLQVDIQVNGTSVGVTANADGSFYSDTRLTGGDRLELSVRADGVAAASGSTRAPSKPAVLDIQLKNVQVDTIHATRVALTLDHAPGEGEYYGIQILAVTDVQYVDGSTDKFYNYLTPGYILSAAESGSFDLEDFVQVNYDGQVLGGKEFMPITLVTRKQFEGAVYSFYLNSYDSSMLDGIRGNMPGGNTGIIGGGIVSGDVGSGGNPGIPDPSKIPAGAETLYYVNFSALSAEFYNYAKALYQSNFDFLSNMGLTPANFTWSNVKGGLGFVGSIATCRLGVLEIPQES